ncbi:hypothetical protein ONJ23_26600, partial [Salmonella enterica subsp. enterica serovar Virginia]|nr:hypothetical protein [Salmonella enterica subsp. enterica serovar Virginia]
DFMLIFYIMYLIKADLGLTDMEGAFLATAAFIGRPFGGALFGPFTVSARLGIAPSTQTPICAGVPRAISRPKLGGISMATANSP